MYSAESIIAALEANEDVMCEGVNDAKCPSPSTHNCPAPENVADCIRCAVQKCGQPVSVHYKHQKFRVLVFKFAVSPRNRNGFIHETDSALMQLIRRGLIDKSRLKSI